MTYINQQLKEKLDMLDDIQRQQTCANTALRLLNQRGLKAMILGGAPRDWLHNRPAKDLDIYIELKAGDSLMLTLDTIKTALYLADFEIDDITTTSTYLLNLDNGVRYVFNILNLAMPVQIILCDREPIKMLELFHGSLSQAYAQYEKGQNLKVQGSKVFELGQRFATHFIKKRDDPNYITKVQTKYPNYTPVFEV